jgi:poly-gamma-glutamate capsule biosynthesis protein CapA/YwtB (metallophosphatase superfamily)
MTLSRENLILVAAGDIIPTRRLFPGTRPLTAGLSEIVERIEAGHVSVANLDIPLSRRGYPREKLVTLRADPELAPDLRRLGFDVLSLANNHVMDYGEIALFDTIEALKASGVQTIGAGRDLANATIPVVLEANGRRVAFLAWTCLLPTGAAASLERPGVAPLHVRVAYEIDPYLQMEEPTTPPTVRSWLDEKDLRLAESQIAALRAGVDLLVVVLHWGGGFSDELMEYQRPLAHALIDAGTDLVIGSHPHRIHGIETYNGKIILYSPGTLIEQIPREGVADDILTVWECMSPDSYIASIQVFPDGRCFLQVFPITRGAERVPVRAEGEIFERIAARLMLMSAEIGTELEVCDDVLVLATDPPIRQENLPPDEVAR